MTVSPATKKLPYQENPRIAVSVLISGSIRLTEAVPSHLHVLFTMKLTLKQQLRPRPLSSVLGLLDLKTGVTVVVLFAVRAPCPVPSNFHPNTPPQVLNKVAGVYGLMAMLTGAGGNAAQLTLYIYSVLALAALAWGIRTINDVCPTSLFCRIVAHFFLFTGESEAHALLCSRLLRRSYPQHHLDSIFCRSLVVIYPS